MRLWITKAQNFTPNFTEFQLGQLAAARHPSSPPSIPLSVGAKHRQLHCIWQTVWTLYRSKDAHRCSLPPWDQSITIMPCTAHTAPTCLPGSGPRAGHFHGPCTIKTAAQGIPLLPTLCPHQCSYVAKYSLVCMVASRDLIHATVEEVIQPVKLSGEHWPGTVPWSFGWPARPCLLPPPLPELQLSPGHAFRGPPTWRRHSTWRLISGT